MRWRTADDDTQGRLFAEPERHVGRGEFRGMTFLHVRARRVVNTLPESGRLPFRHTINAYRGCSHACSYCLDGDTPVLLADGRTRPLRRVRVGDTVVGTDAGRAVPTEVLDHWSTDRPAYRVTLGDGTVLTASADHRFLTDRGWRAVRELGPADVLVTLDGTDPSTAAFRAENGVVRVQPLGREEQLYDLTTGTGDFVAGGVVSHNCFARPTHDYLGLDIDEGFEREIVVKVNAVERVRAELDPRRWAGEPIAMGTNTDPYQRCEGKYRLTQGIVEVLAAARNPFSILTKSTLLLRDTELLAEASRRTDVHLMFSVGTLDEEVWRATEPGTPAPWKRLEAIARLREAGLRCGVLIAPVLPGLSDSREQLERVVKASREAGASTIAGGQLLYLTPPGARRLLRPAGPQPPAPGRPLRPPVQLHPAAEGRTGARPGHPRRPPRPPAGCRVDATVPPGAPPRPGTHGAALARHVTLAGVEGLTEDDAGDDPLEAAVRWVADADAAGLAEPRAMQVATAGPSVRTVLLRGLDGRGFTFFTNLESRKSSELGADPRCALALAWPSLRRQVLATGTAELVDRAEVEAYWATRPRGSQVAAWASQQSRVLDRRATLEAAVAEVEVRFAGADVPAPPFWGGWRVVPLTVELWCGRESRLHDRLRWRCPAVGAPWTRERLWP